MLTFEMINNDYNETLFYIMRAYRECLSVPIFVKILRGREILFEGDSIQVDLFIGEDLIWHNNLSCDIRQNETVTPESISWKTLHSKNDHWGDSDLIRVSTGCCAWNVAYLTADDCYRVYSVEYICEIIPHK